MTRTRIKICGITNIRDASFAVASGADALGFNMYESSSRFVSLETALEIVGQLPPFVTSVALFVNHSAAEVSRVVAQGAFNLLQFHGDETNEFCNSFKLPFIKALRVSDAAKLMAEVADYGDSKAILLDAFVQGEYGGTGKTLDWRALPEINQPVILAGGLNPDNVAQAISLVKPFAVDVCGGVEATKGVKDHGKITDFIRRVKTADSKDNP